MRLVYTASATADFSAIEYFRDMMPWKMNPTKTDDAVALADAVKAGVGQAQDVHVAVCPPAVFLNLLDQILNPSKEINEQFVPSVLTKNNGETVVGSVVNLQGDTVTITTDDEAALDELEQLLATDHDA